jgi:hypothetical protein
LEIAAPLNRRLRKTCLEKLEDFRKEINEGKDADLPSKIVRARDLEIEVSGKITHQFTIVFENLKKAQIKMVTPLTYNEWELPSLRLVAPWEPWFEIAISASPTPLLVHRLSPMKHFTECGTRHSY